VKRKLMAMEQVIRVVTTSTGQAVTLFSSSGCILRRPFSSQENFTTVRARLGDQDWQDSKRVF
jgi:hypothetical protein